MAITLKGEQVIDVDGIKFTIRPQEHNDMVRAFAIANAEEESLKKDDPNFVMDEDTKKRIIGSFVMMERVTAWEGIEINGEPAPCTRQNKNRLFGQVFNLSRSIFEEINRIDGFELKNSEATQTG